MTPGNSRGSVAAQRADVVGGRPVLRRQRHHDVGVAGADRAGGAVHEVHRAVRQADVVEDVVGLARPESARRMNASTWSHSRAVSSMRVPVLARTCRMNWPLSVVGKKSWPSHGTSSGARQADDQEGGMKTARRRTAAPSSRRVAAADALEAALERLLEPREGIARRRAMPAPLRQQEIHRQRRHERARQKYEASIAKTTASASGTNR